MKQLILTTAFFSLLNIGASTIAQAQKDTVKTKNVEITYGVGISIKEKKDTTRKMEAGNARFVGGITFTRLDIGFAKLVDNGSFSLSPANDFLDYKPWKTSTLSFDVLQMGYRFNNHFKVYLAGGFDWTHIRLDKDITFQKNTPRLEDYVVEPIEFSKNRFSSSYVHFPLNFEFRTKENYMGKRVRVVVGPEIGFLLGGKVKQVSSERGKVKEKDNYHFTPFRYGAAVRVGYGGLGVFAKYYASDTFETTNQKGLKTMAFGLTFGLN